MTFQKHSHRPPHYYCDGAWQMVTARTMGGKPILHSDSHLLLFSKILQSLVEKYHIHLLAWVVLPNHYHLLLQFDQTIPMGTWIGRLNGSSSYSLNNLDQHRGRQVWYGYWDTLMREDKGFWNHIQYIHNNPVKHEIVNNPLDWRFSSYKYYNQSNHDLTFDHPLLPCPLFDLL